MQYALYSAAVLGNILIMVIVHLFETLVIMHIVTGTVGLFSLWIPIITKKGNRLHRNTGRIFVYSMLSTGTIAIGISSCTITDPIATHPHLLDHPDFGTADSVRVIFGWMMLYLAFLTINLAWYGWRCVQTKLNREANRRWENIISQIILLILSINCLYHGLIADQVLVSGISIVGLATVATNMWFLYKPKVGKLDWLLEHIKGLVGAGISVYTAFLAFGAVRLLPQAALTPILWSIPLITGMAIIIYQQHLVRSKLVRAS
ncbi:MAG: hypothetical protein AAF410_00020 [Pseudomonadota bacterium]